MNTKKVLHHILVPVAYILMVVANALANILPINGITTGAVSDSYPNLFAPAGITFAIWGVIYILLGAYTIYQVILINQKNNKLTNKENNKNRKGVVDKVNIYFVITSVVNTVWIFAWHYRQISLTVVLMLALLLSLIKIADILAKQKFNVVDTLLINTPFAIYFGWITVATIANITIWLVSVGWDGFGISQDIWTVLILLVGAVIGVSRGVKDNSVPYLLVFVWAYFGIYLKHISQIGFASQYQSVIATLAICGCAFVGVIIFTAWRSIIKPNEKH